MQRIFILLVTICFFFIGLISCTSQERPFKSAEFTVTLQPNPLDSTLTDLYVKNIHKDQSQLFITLPDVEVQHYHPAEFRNGSIYVIRRIHPFPEFPNQWGDELWKYSSMKKGDEIYSSKGMDFRVSPHERDIALVSDTVLYFINASDGSNITQFYPSTLSKVRRKDLQIQPIAWTAGGTFFWGSLYQTVNIFTFFRVIAETWEVDSYDVDTLKINSSDYALNPSNGMLVYSDFPAVFDMETYRHVKKSKMRVHLYLYDLINGESTLLATTHSKDFQPKWLSSRNIEVNNPEGEGRIIISL
ncbi:MAG: hypothetical protein J7M10_04640 [Candidatus Cloacimonetes bacterium]|nr:hypothetical protein [Candidatus Cloacimonadota bacterium]